MQEQIELIEIVESFLSDYDHLFSIMSGCHDYGGLINEKNYYNYDFSKCPVYRLFFYGQHERFDAIKIDNHNSSPAVFQIYLSNNQVMTSSLSFRKFIEIKLELLKKMIKYYLNHLNHLNHLNISNILNHETLLDNFMDEHKYVLYLDVKLEYDFVAIIDQTIDNLKDYSEDIDTALDELKKFPLKCDTQTLILKYASKFA